MELKLLALLLLCVTSTFAIRKRRDIEVSSIETNEITTTTTEGPMISVTMLPSLEASTDEPVQTTTGVPAGPSQFTLAPSQSPFQPSQFFFSPFMGIPGQSGQAASQMPLFAVPSSTPTPLSPASQQIAFSPIAASTPSPFQFPSSSPQPFPLLPFGGGQQLGAAAPQGALMIPSAPGQASPQPGFLPMGTTTPAPLQLSSLPMQLAQQAEFATTPAPVTGEASPTVLEMSTTPQPVMAVPTEQPQIVQQQMVPQQMVPQQMVPQQMIPQQMVPQQLVPQQMAPQQILPQQMVQQPLLQQQQLMPQSVGVQPAMQNIPWALMPQVSPQPQLQQQLQSLSFFQPGHSLPQMPQQMQLQQLPPALPQQAHPVQMVSSPYIQQQQPSLVAVPAAPQPVYSAARPASPVYSISRSPSRPTSSISVVQTSGEGDDVISVIQSGRRVSSAAAPAPPAPRPQPTRRPVNRRPVARPPVRRVAARPAARRPAPRPYSLDYDRRLRAMKAARYYRFHRKQY